MKKILLLLCFVSSLNVFSQKIKYDEWVSVSVVDEALEPTGDSIHTLYCHGMFSNTIVSMNRDFSAKIEGDDKSFKIDLYVYNNFESSEPIYFNDNTFGTVTAILSDGSKLNFDNVFAPKSGGIYISAKDNPDFYKFLKSKESCRLMIMGVSFNPTLKKSMYIIEIR